MRNLKRRLLAMGMAVLMCVSVMPTQLFASEITDMHSEASTEIQIPEEGNSEVISADTPSTEITEETGSQVDSTEDQSKQEVATEELTEEDTEEDTEDEVLEGSMNYLTVQNPMVTAPGTETIVVGIGAEDLVVTDPVLNYRNLTTGQEMSIGAASIQSGVAQFSITYTDVNEKAVYQLAGISYQIGEKLYSVDFGKAGIDAKYGVNQEADTNPSGVITDGDETDAQLLNPSEDLSIVSVDENGNEISQNSIEDAIQSAKADTAQTASEDVSSDQKNGSAVVVLDPGHGGSDPGTTGNGILEKNVNLSIALYCKAELEQYYGVTVYMTRSTDTYVSLDDRTTMAQNWGANVIVSIHNNHNDNTAVSGVEVYYPNSHYNSTIGSWGNSIANVVISQLTALGLVNQGVKIRDCVNDTYPDGSKADYYSIIRNAKLKGFPGIIIEHCFVSNAGDVNNFLNNESGLQRLGIADATGIAQYFGLSKQKPLSIDSVNVTTDHKGIHVNVGYSTSAASVQFRYLYYDVNNGIWGTISEWTTSSSLTWKPKPGTYWIQLGAIDSNGIAKTSTVGLQSTYDYTSHYVELGQIAYIYRDYSIDVGVNYDTDDAGTVYKWQAYNLSTGKWELISDWYQGNWSTWKPQAGDYWLHVDATTTDGKTAGATLPFHVDKNYSDNYLNLNQIGYIYHDHSIDVGVNYDSSDSNTTFYWAAYNLDTHKWTKIADWNGGNWATWTPQAGNYWLQVSAKTSTGISKQLTMCFHVDKNYTTDYVDLGQICVLKHTNTVDLGVNYSTGDSDVAFMWQAYDTNAKSWTTITDWTGANWTTWTPQSGSYWILVTAKTKAGTTSQSILGLNLDMGYLIMGSAGTTLQQMVNYYNAKGSYPAFYGLTDAPNIETFCQIYIQECSAEGVKPQVAFCQAMKETGFLRFGGDVSISQFNFAGLGATGNGVKGASFSSVREGIRAQVQHLKAYASTDPLMNPCVDGRFQYVSRGCAPYVEWLGINENPSGKGWATSKNYGYSIINDYMNKMAAY